ncbi:hypothetical protein RJ639_001983 [Escallonia herrerae]|uniref:Hydrophobic seed protein domain-containing protein n=1 Tax=Escallonia herrerae TaxID=1293975 RepID=A0AA88XBP7_9ASTE|nr:hypothetical protein RJ639_001983 [Escallonia herrerae]
MVQVTHQVLGGLVHIGLGNRVENICCQVIQDLLELEATICLCTAISLKLLNLNIFIPLALQVLFLDRFPHIEQHEFEKRNNFETGLSLGGRTRQNASRTVSMQSDLRSRLDTQCPANKTKQI